MAWWLVLAAALIGAAAAWLWARNRQLQERLQEREQYHQTLETRLREQFENVAQRIFEHSSQKFGREHEQLLTPLKDRLREFSQKVETTYTQEAKERHALKYEIERLVELNQKVSTDAHNLTQALRGDSKIQGDWGEVQLQLILERSGLREGEEYITQGKNLDLKDEQGLRQKPDVIVMLPEKKHLIIDSKVSLTAYHQSIEANQPEQRAECLKQHVISLRSHVDNLSSKHYQALTALNTPDLVLLFTPIEPALSEAFKTDPSLLTYAWDRRIAITSPTLLFAFLRTISSLWVRERQTKNALLIAEEGGKLYDKFVALVEDLEQVAKGLHNTQSSLDASFAKLRDGKGNLLGKVEKLRELGVKTKKQLNDTQEEYLTS